MVTQAVIAAGGLGTRLRPLTDTIPKVMVPILGKPLLEHHIEQFKKHGVKEFFFTLHYLPQVIIDYFGDGTKWGVKVNYFIEKKLLGTAGGIKKFKDKLDESFFYTLGDIFSLVDYSNVSRVFSEKPDAIGMQRIGKTEKFENIDLVEVNDEKLFLKIHPKPNVSRPPSSYLLRGSFLLNKKILSYIPEDLEYAMTTQLLPNVIARGEKFYGYECDDYSQGIDTAEKLREVEEYLKNHLIK